MKLTVEQYRKAAHKFVNKDILPEDMSCTVEEVDAILDLPALVKRKKKVESRNESRRPQQS